MKYQNIFKSATLLSATLMAMAVTSCDDQPDKFELTSGKPVVKYVRVPDPEKADSLLTGAYMDNLICLVGDNLTSIRELYFNDKKAVLNTSYITAHTMLVTVPSEIPEVVTNKMYMVTTDRDTVTYDFNVLVPQPSVRSMSCEWAKPGSEATLIGDYFIDDPNVPLEIILPGNVKVTEFKEITKTRVTFVVPQCTMSGYITVKSIYGAGRSAFQYHDARNILFDWDGSHGGHSTAWGWRDASKVLRQPGDDAWEAIDGAYIKFSGSMGGEIGSTWDEDGFSFNYWPDTTSGHEALSSREEFADLLADYDLANLQVKFEVLVPASNPWQSSAMQIVFTSDADVTYSTASNAYLSNTALPRGLWNPWQATGSYDTAGEWATVAVPLSTFTYNHEGSACGNSLNKDSFTGLTFFVWNGGVAGIDCEPVICIDNIRVVPIE